MSEFSATRLDPARHVHLRMTTPEDVPILFEIQLDEHGNRMAGTLHQDPVAGGT